MMQEFDNEIRALREKYQQLAQRIENMTEQQQQQEKGEAVPRLLPEDVPAATSQATFEILGTRTVLNFIMVTILINSRQGRRNYILNGLNLYNSSGATSFFNIWRCTQIHPGR